MFMMRESDGGSLEACMKRLMLVLISISVALAMSGMMTIACKGGPDYTDADTDGNMMRSLGKSAASGDCDEAADDDGGCPEHDAAGE